LKLLPGCNIPVRIIQIFKITPIIRSAFAIYYDCLKKMLRWVIVEENVDYVLCYTAHYFLPLAVGLKLNSAAFNHAK
jgi:hypothetical protein